MPKFHIRLKVQGLELEVDGERADIPAITSAVQQQLSGLVVPAEAMVDGHKQLGDGGRGTGEEDEKSKGRVRKRGGAYRASTDGVVGQAIEFRHDAAKYGNPLQTWDVTQKSIWLLFVIKGLKDTKEVSGPQLAATFNQYFKPAGKVHPPNVTRELNKAKVQNPASVGEDKGLWYLTDEGDRQAQQLIQNVLNPTTA